jgi:hypothetical protein
LAASIDEIASLDWTNDVTEARLRRQQRLLGAEGAAKRVQVTSNRREDTQQISQEDEPMRKRVAIELVEKSGIGVGKQGDQSVRNMAVVLTTFQDLTILLVSENGLEGKGLMQLAKSGW